MEGSRADLGPVKGDQTTGPVDPGQRRFPPQVVPPSIGRRRAGSAPSTAGTLSPGTRSFARGKLRTDEPEVPTNPSAIDVRQAKTPSVARFPPNRGRQGVDRPVPASPDLGHRIISADDRHLAGLECDSPPIRTVIEGPGGAPLQQAIGFPVRASQRRRVRSTPVLAICRPSGLNLVATTQPR